MKNKEITLTGPNKYDISCEITDKLNEFNRHKDSASKLYICPYDKEHLLIRGFGASRGCIKFDADGVITEIRVYDDNMNFGTHGMFKDCDKQTIDMEMKKFVGCWFKK